MTDTTQSILARAGEVHPPTAKFLSNSMLGLCMYVAAEGLYSTDEDVRATAEDSAAALNVLVKALSGRDPGTFVRSDNPVPLYDRVALYMPGLRDLVIQTMARMTILGMAIGPKDETLARGIIDAATVTLLAFDLPTPTPDEIATMRAERSDKDLIEELLDRARKGSGTP